MQTAKHTPGPWKAAHIGEGEYRKEIVLDVATCGQIAEVLDAGNGVANARLIAAAPDLVEQLKWTENALRWAAQEARGRVKAEIVGGWLHHADKARAAIAKALGK